MKTQYYKISKRTSLNVWWDERRAADKLAKERREWETARDENMQRLMEFKEEAEDYCSVRIIEENGCDTLQLWTGDLTFDAWAFTTGYENAVRTLKNHIPHLDYDPRITSELIVIYRRTDETQKPERSARSVS